MRNSVLQALLTRMHLIKECVIYSIILIFSVVFGINHNERIMEVTRVIFFDVILRSIYPNRTVTDNIRSSRMF